MLDAYDRSHETVVASDGTYKVIVNHGAEPGERVAVNPLPMKAMNAGTEEVILWLHVPLINHDTSGMVILRDGETWFVHQIERRGPAFSAGIEPGDVILSLNGESLNGAKPVDLRRLIRTAGPLTVEFSRCGPPRTVIVQRVPNTLLLAHECCVENSCSSAPSAKTSEKPRSCTGT